VPRHATLRGRTARGAGSIKEGPRQDGPRGTRGGGRAERDHASAFGVARARARPFARFDFRSLAATHPRAHSGLTTVPNVSRNHEAPWRPRRGDDFVGTLRDEWGCGVAARVFGRMLGILLQRLAVARELGEGVGSNS